MAKTPISYEALATKHIVFSNVYKYGLDQFLAQFIDFNTHEDLLVVGYVSIYTKDKRWHASSDTNHCLKESG